MVSTRQTQQQRHSWADDYDNRQQQVFIRQLRMLYQRSLRVRSAVQAPPEPPAMPRLPEAAVLPNGWGPSATPAAAAAAAGTPAAAPAGTSNNAEDPCPNQTQTQPAGAAAAAVVAAGVGTVQAAAATVAAAAPVPAAARNMWQQDDEDDDSDDDEPPGMMEASGEEDDDDEEFEDEEYGEDGEEPEMPELSAGTEEEDNAEEEDAWDAAPAPAVATNAIRHAWNRAGRRAANPATQQQTQQQQTLQQQQLGFSVAVPLLMPQQWQRPSGCSLLQRGVTFEGWQRLSTQTGSRRREEQWTVSVVIQDVDLARGYVAGTMQARNVPGMQQPIETFWEGCIIDDVNNTFYTRAWGASKATDLQHWAKFDGWQDIKSAVVQHSGRCGQLERHPVICMRWKEQFFVHACQQDCGLTIAGFYYVALHRLTGQLRGFYYDPASSPFQELNLRVCSGSSSSSSVAAVDAAGAAVEGGGGSSRRSRRAAQAAAAAAAEGAVDAGQSGSSGAAVGGVCFSSYSFA